MTQIRQRLYRVGMAAGVLALGGLCGCNDLIGHQPLPAGVNNPSFYNTTMGALSMRNATLYDLAQGLPQYVLDAGLLTDELESNQTGASPGALLNNNFPSPIDARILPQSTSSSSPADNDYAALQAVRGNGNQALGALLAYDTAANVPVLRGELYAVEGYAEILLADLFCSGVPLSTVDYQKDFTYHASSTTAQVYQDAVAKEDSALALAGANDTILNLARVLKGRALLDLGQDAQAAQTVAAVPDGFRYQLAILWTGGSSGNLLTSAATISDREGENGLPFISSTDPRVTVSTLDCPSGQTCPTTLYFPNKYSQTDYSQFAVADWIEARLIQAEAALQGGDVAGWLTWLNDLRKTATVPGQTVTPLDTLTDPGSDSARVSLMFQERAYWLFATGHRQGDLRRLIRQYGRRQDQVYPTGAYLAPGVEHYGSDVTAPIPYSEYTNPLFHGCLNRGA